MIYICCFTDGKNDDLSQWRGYASDGTGLCIGFKKNKIKELSKGKCVDKQTKDQNGNNHIDHVSTSFIFAQHEIYYSNKAEIMQELEAIIAPTTLLIRKHFLRHFQILNSHNSYFRKYIILKLSIKTNPLNLKKNIEYAFLTHFMQKQLGRLMMH